jgi:hypothetical protein
MYHQANNPKALEAALPWWEKRYDVLLKVPLDRQRAIRARKAARIAAQVVAESCRRLGKKDQAQRWMQRFREANTTAKDLEKKYF